MTNLYQICSLFGSVKSIVIWCVIGAIVIGLIVLAIFNKVALYAELGILCFALVFTGIFAGYYDVKYFIDTNSIHGESTEGVHNQTLGNYNAITKTFTFTRFGFAPTSEKNKYECILEFKDKSLDLSKEENIYINDEPCSNISKDFDYIKAEYRQVFLDDENITLYDDILYISIHSNKNKLAISLTTKGGDKAVDYWRMFLIENNFKVSFGPNDRPKNTTVDVDSSETPKELFNEKCNELLSSISSVPTEKDLSNLQELQTLIKTYISVNGYDCSTKNSIARLHDYVTDNYFSLDIYERKSRDLHRAYFEILQLTNTTHIDLDSDHEGRYYIRYDRNEVLRATDFSQDNNCSLCIDTDAGYTSKDFYAFSLFAIRNFDEFDWMFDSNNYDYYDEWWHRKDIEHQDLIQNYEFPITSYLILKETSEEFVNSVLTEIFKQAMTELDGKANDTYKINIDLSNYFYNLIYNSNSDSYLISDGAINIEFTVNLSIKN